jgi:hypothetical protein
MGLFDSILEKLGIKKAAAPAAPTAPVTSAPKVQRDSRPVPGNIQATAKAEGATVVVAGGAAKMEMVDVMAKLEKMAKDKGEKLDWKASIVDLLKVLGLDSSLEARKKLAVELGCPPEKMKESTNMNIWLHKTVLQKISENGGNIPQSLLK